MINIFQPSVGEAELAAVKEVFDTNWIGAGKRLSVFMQMFAGHLDVPVRQLQSVSCCTEGLFQAVSALGLGIGDEVILPTISFVGAANAILASGAKPVPCDVDIHTLNPTVDDIAAVVTPQTKAVMVMHYGGHPGHIEAIANFAQSRSIFLIEDAACAIGSTVETQACGTIGDIGIWSFDAMKIVVTGDGGMLWARDPAVGDRIAKGTFLGLESSGMSKVSMNNPWWIVDPALPGRRARMNDISAAIGTVQLGRLPAFLQRRAAIAARYTEALGTLDWLHTPPEPKTGTSTSWYFYWIQTAPHVRDALARHLFNREIYTTFRYWPLHKMQMYANDLPYSGADQASATTLLLPIHNGLSNNEVEMIIAEIHAFQP